MHLGIVGVILINNMNSMFNFYKGKKIFITGHTGFKGTWLTRILLMAGADITGYSLGPVTNPSLFELTKTAKEINSIIGDICNGEKLIKEIQKARPEIVFHLAAQPLVRLSYKEPVRTYETNVMGTVNVLEAVRQTPSIKSFVNVTTDKVYLNKEWIWGYRENEELCGYDPYSNSKSCSELITISYKNSFFKDKNSPAISTARSGNVIGGGDYAVDRIIPDCIRAAESGKAIILRNPDSIRPYQHVLDCLGGYILLAQRQCIDKRMAGSYNFGPDDNNSITTGELATLFCKEWGKIKWEKEKIIDAPHEAVSLKLDCSKSKTILNWKPFTDIYEAIKLTVEWEKHYLNNHNATEITDKQIKMFLERIVDECYYFKNKQPLI